MNIALYVNSFLPTIGGKQLVVYYLAKSLQELGHQARVVGPAGWWRNRKAEFPMPVNRYPSLVRGGLSKKGPRSWLREKELFLQLLMDVKLHECDIIHAHLTYPNGYLAAKAKRFHAKCGVVITPHGDDIHTIPAIGHGMRLNPILRPKIEQALQAVDSITAISDSIEQSLLDAGAPQDKIHKIPNGVDIERFQQSSRLDVRKWLHLPANARLIVSVGNYHPRKGHEVAVKSMPLILSQEPNARLIIVGANTDALKPLIKELRLEQQVILLGTLEFPLKTNSSKQIDYLAEIYLGSDAYASAGIEEGSEGLSLAILEAMSSGLPIVGSDISGNREIINEGRNGFLVAPSNTHQLAERVLQVLNNADLQKRLGENSLEIASKYRWREIATMYLQIYNQVLASLGASKPGSSREFGITPKVLSHK